MSGSSSRPEVEAMTKSLAEVRNDWRKRAGVAAIDVGFNIKGGKPTDWLANRVFVRRKLPAELLPPHEVFPDRLGPHDVELIEAEFGR